MISELLSLSTMVDTRRVATMHDTDSWKPNKDEFLLEDIGYPTQANATKGKHDQLLIITKQGHSLNKSEVPKLKEYVAANNRAFVKNGWLKFKIDGYKEPSEQFMKTFKGLKMGKNLYGAPITGQVLELYKLRDGIHYTKSHDVKSSLHKLPCLSKVPFTEINDKLVNSFGGSDPGTVTRSFWNLIEKLPVNKNRQGRGFLIPYAVIKGEANLGDDAVRSNVDLNNLNTPLLDLKKKLNETARTPSDQISSRTRMEFPASFSVTRIGDGPALAYVNVVLAGGSKCWLVVAARFFNKTRKALIRELQSLNLAKSDHLLTNDFRCIMQHNNILLGPEFYKRHQIPFTVVHQEAGEIMVIGSKVIHCEINGSLNASKSCDGIFSDFHFSYTDDFKQCDCPLILEEDKLDRNALTTDGGRLNELINSVQRGERVTKSGRYYAQPEDIDVLLKGSENLFEELDWKKLDICHMKKESTRYTYRNDKKWTCTRCLKRFTKERGLKDHLKLHSCNKYGICRREGCDKAFDRKERFEKHARWHQEEDKKRGFATRMKTVCQPSNPPSIQTYINTPTLSSSASTNASTFDNEKTETEAKSTTAANKDFFSSPAFTTLRSVKINRATNVKSEIASVNKRHSNTTDEKQTTQNKSKFFIAPAKFNIMSTANALRLPSENLGSVIAFAVESKCSEDDKSEHAHKLQALNSTEQSEKVNISNWPLPQIFKACTKRRNLRFLKDMAGKKMKVESQKARDNTSFAMRIRHESNK